MPDNHILFVTGEYPPQDGGVGAYTAELGKALTALGLKVSVLTSAGVGPSEFVDPSGIRVYPEVRRWTWRIWHTVPARAERLQADWVHVQYQTAAYQMNPAINFAPKWWQRRGVRVAWTYHDLRVPYLFPKVGDRLRHWVTEYPAQTCDLTVVTNEGDRLQLHDKTRKLAKIPIGSNIQGHRFSADERREHRRQRGFSVDDLIVGYFGFLNRSKGGKVLIRALHSLAQKRGNAQLFMIGERVGASDPTNYAYLQEVEELANSLGLASRIRWTGRQPDEGVSADLNICDVLLMPYEDGASLRRGTLMAGLANGCAIVTTTPQAPLPELVDRRDLLYIAPGDAEAAAAAVLEIAGDTRLASTLHTNAYARSQLFTWKEIADQHDTLYAAKERR